MNKSIILDLLIRNHNPNDISRILNTDKKLCNRIYHRFRALKKNDRSNQEIRSIILDKKYHKRKFTKDMENSLAAYLEIDDNKFDIIKKIKKGFEIYYKSRNNEKISFHQNTYYKILNRKERMNYSLKKCPNYTLYYNNSEKMKSLRKDFVEKYLFFKKKGFRFIYLDEFGISKHMHPKRGWSLKGIKIKTKNNIVKSRNLSVVCAISDESLLNYKIFEKGIRSFDFFMFLFEMVQKNNFLNEKVIFVLDNAHVHNSRFYKKADKYINLFFLPEYTPQLNPIENFFFHMLKSSFCKDSMIRRKS